MKKVGIITIHNSPNYGACLQSYALYYYIVSKGCDCEIMDVHRPVHDDYIYEKEYSSFRNNPFTFRKRFFGHIRHLAKKILGREDTIIKFTSAISEERFNNFNSQIRYSKVYNKLSDLKKNPPIYDLYISGSDQLWNPDQPYCLEPYFLTFAPKGKEKISFATSIGITELTSKEKSYFKTWLSTYNAVSVREIQAKKLLDSFIDTDIIRVADPTFLLPSEYWKSIAVSPNNGKGYILLYLLSRNNELIQYAEQLALESGKELVILKDLDIKTEPGRYVVDNDCGPKEWIGYLQNAELVITDSFHCTVFSILMGADNFYSYINPLSKRGSRIVDLLTRFGLEDHLLPVDFNIPYSILSSLKIDKDKINNIVEEERTLSRNFLNQWL